MSWALLPQQVLAQLAFMAPDRLLILLVIPLLILAYIFASLRKNRRGMRFTNTSMLDVVVPKQSQWRRHLAVALSLLSLITLTAAFATWTFRVYQRQLWPGYTPFCEMTQMTWPVLTAWPGLTASSVTVPSR